MSLPRRRVQVPPGLLMPGRQALPREEVHYVVDVLRLKPGALLILFDGEGRRAQATLLDGGAVEVLNVENVPPPERPAVTLVCALSKGEKLDFIVEKASETGAAALWPVIAARSVVQLKDDKAAARLERWERVAAAAARQSGRDHLLHIEPVQALEDALMAVQGAHKRVLVPGAEPLSRTLPAAPQSVVLLTGPEGGFDAAEVDAAKRAGFVAAGLGPLVLRAETAPLVALTVVLAHAGRM